MKKWLLKSALIWVFLIGAPSTYANTGYDSRVEAQRLIAELSAEGLDEAALTQWLSQAKRKDSILKAISRPAEKRLNWGEYRKIFITKGRIEQGVAFWNTHRKALQRAEKNFGVPAEIIVAIIGVETRYGKNMGSYRVLDALATLGFDYPPRSEFFLKQLKAFFQLTHQQKLNPTLLKGSYAGAMGYGQFIPSSYLSYAIDFDQDGKIDIWNNPVDAIGSVANYFKSFGWQEAEPVITPVVFNSALKKEMISTELLPEITLKEWQAEGVSSDQGLDKSQKATLIRLQGDESVHYWFGLANFYVITRYNHSQLYAMAVYELSQAIREVKQK